MKLARLLICDPARRNPQKVAEPQSEIQPIFDQWGCYTALLGFFTDYSSQMFISQFPANKITEIDLEVCEKVKFPHHFAVIYRFITIFKCVFLEIVVSLYFDFQSP